MFGAIVSTAVGLITSVFGSKKAKKERAQLQRYQASSSYVSALRSVELEREQRQLSAAIATEQKGYVEGVRSLESELFRSVENAELLKGAGPVLKPLPIESFLLPVGLALVARMVFRK